MPTVEDILSEIDDCISGQLTLSVVRSWDEFSLHPERILLDDTPSQALRDNCGRMHHLVEMGSPKEYEGTAELEGNDFFVIDDDETIDELALFDSLRGDVGAMPILRPSDLDDRVVIYCVSVGDSEPRILFIKKVDPRLTHRPGRFMAIGRDRLKILDEPTFAFSHDFDLIIGSNWAIVINQRPFEMLFREIGIVREHVENWITGITDHLEMTEESVGALRNVALRDSRTWRKLKEIKRRGHLSIVSLDEVRQYASHVGLDPDVLVVDDKLVFDPAERFSILYLLNEDLYRGDLTDDVFEAQRKASA